MIVAIRRGNEETIFNPKDDETLCAGNVIVVMGPEADIEKFYENCIASEKEAVLV